MVRRVLKDNKVPGMSAGTRVVEASRRGAGSASGFLGESQVGLCERQGACSERGGGGVRLELEEFLKKKEKIEAFSGCLENSPQQLWTLVPPPPQPLAVNTG